MRKRYYFGVILFAAAAVILIGGLFYPLPYFIIQPGMAMDLKPIITVKNGFKEKGSFMLTTVSMGRANIYSYAEAKMNKYDKIYSLDEVLSGTETENEYNIEQLFLMKDAKITATDVAYHKAGLPVKFHNNGIYVLSVLPDMPAYGKIKAGDQIFKVDGHELLSSKQFMDYVGTKKAGDNISFTYSRNKQVKNTSLKIASFKKNPKKVGIGIYLADDQEIVVNPPVQVETDEIGGPSAGLMFALEIYNQLTKDDLTKGYKIAGTGTISPDGTVGPIGGIQQKIIAADKAGAEIFFAPNEYGIKNSNYHDALKTARDIKTRMKIVPVDTFNEACSYLERLPKK